jgi:diguanylate cyclase (GGDEF)-like protein
MAAVQRARGHVDTAQETLDLCLRTCAENGLAGLRVQAREEQAELHAAAGRYREAYEEYRRFHIETTELRSRERDARARVLQAMYETGEARRQVREYRELSQRDALTGLYNRRRVEEEVPRLLRTGADRRHVVTVALLDLDHFKRINDTCSHDVGDQVLCAVADLLESAVASVSGTGSFTARMGGEEFLLVLVTADVPTASHRLEEIRRALQHHPWDDLTEGLPVTVSIGAVSVGPDVATPTLGQLLGRADAHLYVAKSQGRNRVVSDAG